LGTLFFEKLPPSVFFPSLFFPVRVLVFVSFCRLLYQEVADPLEVFPTRTCGRSGTVEVFLAYLLFDLRFRFKVSLFFGFLRIDVFSIHFLKFLFLFQSRDDEVLEESQPFPLFFESTPTAHLK